MAPALSIWTGQTGHHRISPFDHRLCYRLAYIQLDLGRLGDAGKTSRLFSIDRFNLFSFSPKDHGPRDGSDLAAWARQQFSNAGLDLPPGTCITLLCQPRVLGYQFNPISIFQAVSPDGDVLGAIYEVHNTFGDAHAYVAVFGPEGPARHSTEKRFHVSPFFDVSGRYEFDFRQSAGDLSLSIVKSDENGPNFRASMTLQERPATTAGFATLFRQQPFSTFKTIAAIHWEALKIWIKGGRYHPRPEPPDLPATRIHLGQNAISS